MGGNPGAWTLPFVLAIGVVLAGCSSSSGPGSGAKHAASRGYYKIGAPYQVNGVWYHPKVDYNYDETGLASWYGEAFNGKPTANGEVFDLNQVSAAHKTLQLPSVVEVTNLRNGRALQMRVNDRGPFVGDRIIDLSRRAAQLLGFEGAGTAPVRVRILKEESIRVAEAAMRGEIGQVMVAQAPRTTRTEIAARAPEPTPATPPADDAPRRHWPSLIASAHAEPSQAAPQVQHSATRSSGRIFIQAGAFAVPENAQRVRTRIASLASTEVVRALVNGAALYRVRLGPVASEADAKRLLSRVVDSGYPGARVVDE